MWISKKEWNKLQHEIKIEKENSDEWFHKYCEIKYSKANYISEKVKEKLDYAFARIKSLKEENKTLSDECNNYKKLYLDELQKRLDLAKHLKELQEKRE